MDICDLFLKIPKSGSLPGVPEVVDGYFSLPNGPGLGVTLNEDVIEANPRRQFHFNLFEDDWHKRHVDL